MENVEFLELRVHCPGSFQRARAVWLDPYVITSKSDLAALEKTLKRPIPPREATKIYLSDMDEIEPKVGFGRFGKNGVLGYLGDDARITVADKVYPKGLSTHPPGQGASSVKYRLPNNAKVFHTLIGVCQDVRGVQNPEKQPPDSPLEFRVLGDGKILWKSAPLQAQNVTLECRIDVKGISLLELQVHCPGSFGRARAVWLDPCILTTD